MKHLKKAELYSKICDFYHARDTDSLSEYSSYYLELFKDLDDDEVHMVMFFHAFSKSSTELYEELLMNQKISSSVRTWSEYNVSMLYPREQTTIPKIIHLLYFGETEFYNIHYHCISSIIRTMSPEYEIILYNNKEPVNNRYWDKIKNYVQIKPITIPEEFDGFPLHHFQYKADVCRMNVLYENGGIYLDIDMYIYRNIGEILKSNKSVYISREGQGDGLINAFIACTPKNEFIRLWFDKFRSGLRMDIWAYHIRESNMNLIKKYPYYIQKYQIEILDHEYLFPYSWVENHKFMAMTPTPENEKIYGVHLFETILYNNIKDLPMFNKLIPHKIHVITVEERPERTALITRYLDLHDVDYHLFINKMNSRPIIGCLLSHIKAIEYAKENDMDEIMVVEDDIIFRDLSKIHEMKPYPADWDMIYYGGILTHHTAITDGWIKGITWCNHAYVVRKGMYDIILSKFAEMDIDDMFHNKQCIDWFYTTHIHPHYNCYLANDQYIVQRENYSDIDNRMKWSNNFNWDTFAMKQI